jgi:hypothetical protein
MSDLTIAKLTKVLHYFPNFLHPSNLNQNSLGILNIKENIMRIQTETWISLDV